MARDKPWFDHLVDRTGEYFCSGIVGGSASHMLEGMYNSTKGERLIQGSQALRVSATGWASRCALYGGLSTIFKSSMIYVRQKDDPWNYILAEAAAAGFVCRHQGLGPASRMALIFGLVTALVEGYLIVDNKMSNVQSSQPDFEELCPNYILSLPQGPY